MPSPDREPRITIDFSKVPPQHHEYAAHYKDAREGQAEIQQVIQQSFEVKRDPQSTLEQILQADIEYSLAIGYSHYVHDILFDPRSGFVSNAVVEENDRVIDPRGYLGEVED